MKRIIITGGTYSGKTTLIESLSRDNLVTVPEAGLIIIEQFNKKHGIMGQKDFRKEKPTEFFEMIAKKQIELETEKWDEGHKYIFLDRGLYDYSAFCQLVDADIPELINEELKAYPVELVFFCESLGDFSQREESGWGLDKDASVMLIKLLRDIYSDMGIRIIDLPKVSVEERIGLVKKNLEY